MAHAFICDAVRTPFGRCGGPLAPVRTDNLAAIPLRALLARNPKLDAEAMEEVILGCANQAGEDNRNVARMAPVAARGIRSSEIELAIAGGVESMTRAPLVLAKPDAAWARGQKMEDTTLGWRFVNPLMKARYSVDSMAETAGNVAAEYGIERSAQDSFALRSQQRPAAAVAAGNLAEEIVPVEIPKKGAFAVQTVADLRLLGLPDDAAHVNPNGGAIALGHPLGASGARLLGAAVRQLERIGGRYAPCTMCIGVGQGIATLLERV